MCKNCNLTPAQHRRLATLPEDYKVVGWDPAYSSPGCAGPIIEDPLNPGQLNRLSPRGKLINNPSSDAIAAIWDRREGLGMA